MGIKSYCFMMIVFGASVAFGMDDQGYQTPPSKPRQSRLSLLQSPAADRSPSEWTCGLLHTEYDAIMPAIIDAINAVPAGGYVGVDNKYLTDRALIAALAQAAQRGVHVVLNAGTGVRADVRKQLAEAGVLVVSRPSLHAKRYVIAQKEPHAESEFSRETLGSSHVFLGSYNASMLAPHHKEVMEHVQDDAAFFKQNFIDQMEIAAQRRTPEEKKVLRHTPGKRTITRSQEYDSLRSKSCRLAKLIESDTPTDCIDITSMTFDSEEITAALEMVMQERANAAPRIRVFLDQAAQRHPDLLKRLVESGVSVYIYNHDRSQKIFKKFPQLQHSKMIIRRCSDECLTVISTGNLTKQSNREINIDAYHPCDPKLFNQIQELNDELLKECVRYGV